MSEKKHHWMTSSHLMAKVSGLFGAARQRSRDRAMLAHSLSAALANGFVVSPWPTAWVAVTAPAGVTVLVAPTWAAAFACVARVAAACCEASAPINDSMKVENVPIACSVGGVSSA